MFKPEDYMADKQVSSSYQKPSYGHSFDTESYLRENFSPQKIDPTRLDFPLQGLHKLFGTSSYSGVNSGEMNILDYGCGPVPIYTISAATHASEIVFADYTEKNRRELQRWVEGDPQSFDWSHCFDYVVKTLEGGTDDQARKEKNKFEG